MHSYRLQERLMGKVGKGPNMWSPRSLRWIVHFFKGWGGMKGGSSMKIISFGWGIKLKVKLF